MLKEEVLLRDMNKVMSSKRSTFKAIQDYIDNELKPSQTIPQVEIDQGMKKDVITTVYEENISPLYDKIISNTRPKKEEYDFFDMAGLRVNTFGKCEDVIADFLECSQNYFEALEDEYANDIKNKLDDYCFQEIDNLYNSIDDEIGEIDSWLFGDEKSIDDLVNFYRNESKKSRKQYELINDVSKLGRKNIDESDYQPDRDDLISEIEDCLESNNNYHELLDLVDFLEFNYGENHNTDMEDFSNQDENISNNANSYDSINLHDDYRKTRRSGVTGEYSFTRDDDLSENFVDKVYEKETGELKIDESNEGNQGLNIHGSIPKEKVNENDVVKLYDDIEKTRNYNDERSKSYTSNDIIEYNRNNRDILGIMGLKPY